MSRQTTPKAPAATPRKAAASPAAKTRKATKAATGALPEAPVAAEPLLTLELSAGPALLEGPTREELIRRRAYERYESHGSVGGRETEDWLAAEAEVGALMTEGSKSVAQPRE